ncbi:MAG: hypothetical protein JWL59_3004 [Chthoniobacteraceae bacterium]|nr:hypothetical protein [Chthoniobacteraceae bacterium]
MYDAKTLEHLPSPHDHNHNPPNAGRLRLSGRFQSGLLQTIHPMSGIPPVRMNPFNSTWYVARPVVVFGRTFAILTAVFCVATPFIHDLPNRWTFFFGGFGYSAFLAFFVTGLLLLPQQTRTRIFTALFIGVGFSVIIPIIILAILSFGLPFSIIRQLMPPLLWGTGTLLATMFTFACYGWYHRLTHAATNVAQSSALLNSPKTTQRRLTPGGQRGVREPTSVLARKAWLSSGLFSFFLSMRTLSRILRGVCVLAILASITLCLLCVWGAVSDYRMQVRENWRYRCGSVQMGAALIVGLSVVASSAFFSGYRKATTWERRLWATKAIPEPPCKEPQAETSNYK